MTVSVSVTVTVRRNARSLMLSNSNSFSHRHSSSLHRALAHTNTHTLPQQLGATRGDIWPANEKCLTCSTTFPLIKYISFDGRDETRRAPASHVSVSSPALTTLGYLIILFPFMFKHLERMSSHTATPRVARVLENPA